ncbi:MAG TPA: hypothetical protein VF123_21440 [Candidatus Sulfotelmatobacter sp.]
MTKTIALVITLVALTTANPDFSGRWSGNFRVDGGDHNVPQLFIFQQQGTKLSGSGGPNEGEQYPIENGRILNDDATFEVTTGEWKFTYHLKRGAKDELQGDLKLESVGDSRTAKVSLKRVKEK